jgi:DNA-binding LacI/PurR family transcriptional regulator
VVWLLGKIEGAIGDVSSFDADRAGALAARYLWENGHTSLGFLNPRPGHIQFEKLKQGFATAGRKLGAKCSTLEPEREVTSSWPLPAIRNDSQIGPLVDAWLAINAKARPTALFVPADSIAVHLYTALQKRSLHVGRDMSVISCNHELPITMSLNPSLATLDLNAEQIGCNAVRQLLWRIDHTLERNSVQILIEPRIVPGDSVGVPGDSVGKLR